ncbi:MAG: DUF2878 domain-containing protein [Lysobacterales bacterium]|nr:MAG: DUF2878 domain-containing protein [Xanthomonadales bacterium]
MNLVVNFVAFQLGWFACVLGAAKGLPWAGVLVVLAVIALHLARVRRPLPELRLVGLAMALGLLVDSLLLATGWLSYPTGLWLPGLAPYWIVAMWGLFATTLNVSMGWLRGRPLLAVLMGAVGGPLSYLGGEKLGGIELTEPVAAMAALAVAWAVAMPLLMMAAERLDGVRERALPEFVRRDWRLGNHA